MGEVLTIVTAAIALKLLLIPAYHSTDFEVHRNWMALTHSLPLDQWYYEKTSIWTLDYPPFFAWFEFGLSHLAKYVDKKMLDVKNLEYDAFSVVMFQRSSVILTELLLLWTTNRFVNIFIKAPQTRYLILALIAFSPGLLIVDHIHFQYNGFLFGILVWSIVEMIEGRFVLSGILFAALLCFKHIFLYLAPAYFIYLLRVYCLAKPLSFGQFFGRLTKLGGSVLGVLAIAFLPFAKHIPQILTRLFPFKRGLNHAYWAPNAWCLYAFADRVLTTMYRKLNWPIPKAEAAQAATRGLVGDASFAILPEITPLTSLIATVLAQIPPMIKLWRNPTPTNFIKALVECAFGSFLFGWHVHEKAVLLMIIPLSLILSEKPTYGKTFWLLQVAGHFSLFPLLFTPAETPIKSAMLVVYSIVVWSYLAQYGKHSLSRFPVITSVIVFLFSQTYGFLIDATRWEFLPLMMTSVTCAVFVVYSWLRLVFSS